MITKQRILACAVLAFMALGLVGCPISKCKQNADGTPVSDCGKCLEMEYIGGPIK